MPVQSCVLEMADILNNPHVFGPERINSLVDTYFANLNPYPKGSRAPKPHGKNQVWTQETWEQTQQENRQILAARLAMIKQIYTSGDFMDYALRGSHRIEWTTPVPIRPHRVLPK